MMCDSSKWRIKLRDYPGKAVRARLTKTIVSTNRSAYRAYRAFILNSITIEQYLYAAQSHPAIKEEPMLRQQKI